MQALAIAACYAEEWPLLIVCSSLVVCRPPPLAGAPCRNGVPGVRHHFKNFVHAFITTFVVIAGEGARLPEGDRKTTCKHVFNAKLTG